MTKLKSTVAMVGELIKQDGSASMARLGPGDIIEIKFPLVRNFGGEEYTTQRWIGAEVIACDEGAWPLVRLDDGQMTELRRFMTWRPVARARASGPIAPRVEAA